MAALCHRPIPIVIVTKLLAPLTAAIRANRRARIAGILRAQSEPVQLVVEESLVRPCHRRHGDGLAKNIPIVVSRTGKRIDDSPHVAGAQGCAQRQSAHLQPWIEGGLLEQAIAELHLVDRAVRRIVNVCCTAAGARTRGIVHGRGRRIDLAADAGDVIRSVIAGCD